MKKDPLVWIALLSLFAFHVINNMVIIFRDTMPFVGDASVYYQLSFKYEETWMAIVKGGDLSLLTPILGVGLGGELLALVAIPFLSFFGVSQDVAILANQSFFLILILSMFGLGKLLFNRRTGLLAAFLISFYPGVVGFSRVYMLEVPVLAISTACVYLLIKSGGFKNFKYSLCFGFAFALGELIRPRFVVYIIIPVLFYAIKNIALFFRRAEVPAHISATKMAINTFSSVVLSCLLLFPWYSMDKISGYLRGQKLWSSWPALSSVVFNSPHFLRMLMMEYLGWFFVSLFILALGISFFEKNKRPKIYFLLMWFVFTLILVSMLALQGLSRLAVSLLAPVALISSVGMEWLSRLKIGKYLLMVFLFFLTSQYFLISYNPKPMGGIDVAQLLGDVTSKGLLQAGNGDWALDELMSTFEKRGNSDEEWGWKFINNEISQLIGECSRQWTNDFIKVLDVNFQGTVIHNAMEDKILTGNLPIAVIGLYPDEANWKILFSDQELQHMVLGADYVIRRKVKPKGSFIDKILDIFDANISRFEKLKTLETPWGEISIYEKKKFEENV
ncbi:MAG: glycosyltransferase family 39 protein [Candidatus Omnitrophota bacterium]